MPDIKIKSSPFTKKDVLALCDALDRLKTCYVEKPRWPMNIAAYEALRKTKSWVMRTIINRD